MMVCVLGTQKFQDYNFMARQLEKVAKIDVIATDGVGKTSRFAEQWAATKGISFRVFKAEWHKHGKKATHARKNELLDFSDMVIFFECGNGDRKDIQPNINLAKKKAKTVLVFTLQTKF